MWAFGKNKDGELGLGSTTNASSMVQVQGLKSAKSIDSGQHHTVIVSKEGEVFACGSSLHGKLGLPAFGLINVQKFT